MHQTDNFNQQYTCPKNERKPHLRPGGESDVSYVRISEPDRNGRPQLAKKLGA
jgi:hypothetical protein